MNVNKLAFIIIISWIVLLGSPAVVLPQTAGTTLSFSAPVSTTILDKDGQGTGFTSVQPNAAGNQYDADRIDLDTALGSLKMTATQEATPPPTIWSTACRWRPIPRFRLLSQPASKVL